MQAFFTADMHLGHGNIIKYAGRPFKDADHMNKSLITNWNMRVKPEDVIYHLGDFCCKGNERGVPGNRNKAESWEKELNGRIIHIKGNHDTNNSVKNALEFAVIQFGNYIWFMSHRPPRQLDYEIPSHIDIFLCGHVHEKWHVTEYEGKPVINVGIDVNRYMPLKKQELIKIIKCGKYEEI